MTPELEKFAAEIHSLVNQTTPHHRHHYHFEDYTFNSTQLQSFKVKIYRRPSPDCHTKHEYQLTLTDREVGIVNEIVHSMGSVVECIAQIVEYLDPTKWILMPNGRLRPISHHINACNAATNERAAFGLPPIVAQQSVDLLDLFE